MKSSDGSLHGTYFDHLEAKHPDLAPEVGRAVQRTPRRRPSRRSLAPGLLFSMVLLAGAGWLVIEWWPEAVWRQSSTQAPATAVPVAASTGVPSLLGETPESERQNLVQQPAVESRVPLVPAVAGNRQLVDDVEARAVAREPIAVTVPESLAGIEELASLEASETSPPLASKSLEPEWIAVSGDEASVLDETSVLDEVGVIDEVSFIDEAGFSDEVADSGAASAVTGPLQAAAQSTIPEDSRAGSQVAQNPAPAAQPVVGQPAASAPVRSGPLEVGGAVKPPRRLVTPLPRYPDAAWAQGITGDVLVRAIIDEHGKVADIEVLRGLPHGMTEAAIEAIERWRFAPATRNGEAVSVYRNLSVRFES